jgi:putative molybdopterin biosynthesis protein
MSESFLTAKELSKYLSINEKKIYALIKRGDIPCTKKTGKWLFPKKLIDKWIEDDIQGTASPEPFENINIMGSHDLAIDILASEVNEQFPQLIILSAHIGSVGGLRTLQHSRAHMAGVHLLHPETKEYNLPYLPQYIPEIKAVVVHFLNRDQGFIMAQGNPLAIRGFEDLTRPDVRFINRQEGAGTRLLLDYHLGQAGIEGWQIHGYDSHVTTHTEVAMAIRSGQADVGLGLRAAAQAFGLDFIPITKERFDFVIPKAIFYTQPIQELLEVVRSESFKLKVAKISGYDSTDTGRVLAWT